MIKNGDSVCFTESKALFCACIAVGVKPLDEAPYFYKLQGGEEKVVWYLEEKSQCGQYITADLLKNAADEGWRKKNKDHKFVIALDAVESYEQATEWIEEDIPYAEFALDEDRTLWAKLGTVDYKEAIQNGMKPL